MDMGIIKLIDKAEIKLEHVLENDPRTDHKYSATKNLYENKVKVFTEDYKLTFESYPSLIYLSLINIGLESLKNFPYLKFLEIVRNIK